MPLMPNFYQSLIQEWLFLAHSSRFKSLLCHHQSLKKVMFSESKGLILILVNLKMQCVPMDLSVNEMDLSEDYTCVISRGPNSKTTRIFDNCVVESCDGVPSPTRKENKSCYPSQSFLSLCHYCKSYIEQGKDIYMYRGEKAFCSSECRYQEMLLDEEEERS